MYYLKGEKNMNIFKNNIRAIFTSPIKLVIIFIIPIVFISLFLIGDEGSLPTKVAIIDNDNTRFTSYLVDELDKSVRIVECEQDEILDNLMNYKIDYALVINEHYTKKLFSGDQSLIDEYYFIGEEKLYPLKVSINTFVQNAKVLYEISSTEDEFYSSLNELNDYKVSFVKEIFSVNSGQKAIDSLGFIVLFLIYSSAIIVSSIVVDKENNVTVRILSSATSLSRYLFEHFLSFVFLEFIIVTVMLLSLKVIFIFSFGGYFIPILLLMLLFSLTIAAFSLMVLTICKKSKIFYWVMVCLATPIVMLSGCYFDTSAFPQVVQNIAKFLPSTWLMIAIRDISLNRNTDEIAATAFIFLAFIVLYVSISRIGLKKLLRVS